MNDDPLAPDSDAAAPRMIHPWATETWWFVLWRMWGTLLALLVAWRDQSILLGLPWFLGGIFLGACGWQIWMWLAEESREYFRDPDWEELLAAEIVSAREEGEDISDAGRR